MAHNLLKGRSPDIINTNVKTLMDSGKHSHASALRCAMCYSNKGHRLDAARVSKKVSSKTPVRVKIV